MTANKSLPAAAKTGFSRATGTRLKAAPERTARTKAQRGWRRPDPLVATPGGAHRLHPLRPGATLASGPRQRLRSPCQVDRGGPEVLLAHDALFRRRRRAFSHRRAGWQDMGGRYPGPSGRRASLSRVHQARDAAASRALAEGPLLRTRRWRGPYPCRCREKRERQALAALRGPGQIWRPSPAYAGSATNPGCCVKGAPRPPKG